MADKDEYVSAWTRSKGCLETIKAVVSKAHQEGGYVTSSKRLASVVLLLGIAEPSEDEAEIIQLSSLPPSSARTRGNRSPTKLHYEVRKQDNGRKPCTRNCRHWLRITLSLS